MKKYTFGELVAIMRQFNKENPDKENTACKRAVIVYRADNFNKLYTKKELSYEVTNANRLFQNGKISNALHGNCLDGKDIGVRLDYYNWNVDYCYFINEF